jgi:hypothetical protein
MKFQEYYDSAKRASDLLEQGDHAAALGILKSLIDGELPDLDKAMMAMNVAIVCQKLGQEGDALAWYDYGIGLEAPLMRFSVAEAKAAYLVSKGRKAEALVIYESLLAEKFLMFRDRDRLQQYVAAVRQSG